MPDARKERPELAPAGSLVAEQSGVRWVFLGEHRLRAGWRLLVFLLLSSALAFVGQLAASVLPRESLLWATPGVGLLAALLAGWILLARLEDRAPGALGFPLTPAAPRELLAGTALGGALITLAALLLLVSGNAAFSSDAGTVPEYLRALLGSLLFFGVAAAWEEALFRGYAFQVLVEGLGVWPAVGLSSAAFAAVHLGNPNVGRLAVANIFLAGVLLALAYLKTRSLWFATAVHLGWNWAMASLLDFPVSGLVFDTPLYDVRETGPDWWTGGAFGPEAGLAGTAVLLLGTLWLARTRRLAPDARLLALRPIVDRRLSENAECGSGNAE